MDSLAISILKEFGPVVGLIAYYVWRDFVNAKLSALREARLAERLTFLEDYIRGELVQTIRQATLQSSQVVTALEEFVDAAKTRPCLVSGHDFRAPQTGPLKGL